MFYAGLRLTMQDVEIETAAGIVTDSRHVTHGMGKWVKPDSPLRKSEAMVQRCSRHRMQVIFQVADLSSNIRFTCSRNCPELESVNIQNRTSSAKQKRDQREAEASCLGRIPGRTL